MSLTYIPFQPVYFGDIPTDCGPCEPAKDCVDNSVGGVYASNVQPGDITQFQFALDICPDATQLFTDPNFLNGVDDWQVGFIGGSGGSPQVENNTVGLPMGTYIFQSTNLQPNTTYLVRVNVLEIEGIVSIFTDDNQYVELDNTGVQEVIVTTGANPNIAILPQVSITETSSVIIDSMAVYEWFSPSDIVVEVTDGTTTYTVPDSDKTIDAGFFTGSVDWQGLSIPSGIYTIVVTDGCGGDPATTIESQPFNLATTHKCTTLIYACMGGYNLGFNFNTFSPTLRVEYDLNQLQYPNERERYTDTNDRHTVYWGRMEKLRVIRTAELPEYLLDFLATLPMYSNIIVSGSSYAVENDSIDPQMNAEYSTWGTVELELRMTNYPLVVAKCDDEEPACALPPNCWLWEDGEEILWEDDLNNVCIRYN